ncbi:MAG: HAMP domain-containing histidine kinase [Chloroflexi bacterium]|nr:HAMP domain-containing histidine kinase [Chloroflexota bacterium]
MKYLRELLILLPIGLGVLASILAQVFFSPVPLLVFKIDVGMVVFIFGVFVTLLLFMSKVGGLSREREARKRIDLFQYENAESRRQFIRRLDHEIKNPLTGLRTALVNLREAGAAGERERAAENASRAAERLSKLLADLRKLSDLEERPLERLPVDVPQLLEEMVEAVLIVPSYENRKVDLLISRVPWPMPSVTGDRDLLGLGVYNLLDNALKFTSANDSVELRARVEEKSVVIEVADSGAGIASDEVPKVFEELYRGTNARGIEGSGLGLALVHRIVTLHGGRMNVRSSQEGPRGTVFAMQLPL